MLTIVNKMETAKKPSQKIMLALLKEIGVHTATLLAKKLKMSRWGVWKILKKLEYDKLIVLSPIGSGKTSTCTIDLNWNDVLTEKALAFHLTQEALKHKRWRFDFEKLEKEVEFLILFGSIIQFPKDASDIDILGVTKENKIGKIGNIVLEIQQAQNKKIHSINFTKKELKQELKEKNKAFIDAIKEGIVLFGQEKFISFMREVKGYGS